MVYAPAERIPANPPPLAGVWVGRSSAILKTHVKLMTPYHGVDPGSLEQDAQSGQDIEN